jgi:hypothetical protein
MKTEPTTLTSGPAFSGDSTGPRDEAGPTALRRWMNQKVHLTISRGWLAGLAGAFLILAMLALD